MTLFEELSECGVDISDGLNRLINNEAVYEKLLKKLPESVKQQEVLSFLDSGDIETAIQRAHSIKGVTGNLSVTPLYSAYTEIVNLLRANKLTEARELYIKTSEVQEKIFQIIQKY